MNIRKKAFHWLYIWFPLAVCFIFMLAIVYEWLIFLTIVLFIIHMFLSYRVFRCPNCRNPMFKNGPYGIWTPFVPKKCVKCGYPLGNEANEDNTKIGDPNKEN